MKGKLKALFTLLLGSVSVGIGLRVVWIIQGFHVAGKEGILYCMATFPHSFIEGAALLLIGAYLWSLAIYDLRKKLNT